MNVQKAPGFDDFVPDRDQSREMEESLKFAFDVDGVISEMPEVFSAITKALRRSGHRILIVTDFDERFRQFREQELIDYRIEYDELVITSDKEAFCLENDVDFAFDDDADYFPVSKQLRINVIFTQKVDQADEPQS